MDEDSKCEAGVINFPNGKTMGGHRDYEGEAAVVVESYLHDLQGNSPYEIGGSGQGR